MKNQGNMTPTKKYSKPPVTVKAFPNKQKVKEFIITKSNKKCFKKFFKLKWKDAN